MTWFGPARPVATPERRLILLRRLAAADRWLNERRRECACTRNGGNSREAVCTHVGTVGIERPLESRTSSAFSLHAQTFVAAAFPLAPGATRRDRAAPQLCPATARTAGAALH